MKADNLAFFPELDLVLNRIKKSGNTSLVLFLEDLASGDKQAERIPKQVKLRRSLAETPFGDVLRTRHLNSLVCVRHPVARAVSAFLHLIVNGNRRILPGMSKTDTPSAAAFEEFLSRVADTDPSKLNRHFWRQSDLLFQPVERFTFVVKLERLAADMEHVLSELRLPTQSASALSAPHPAERAMKGKITGGYAKDLLLTPKAYSLIELIYAEDFETFGYSS